MRNGNNKFSIFKNKELEGSYPTYEEWKRNVQKEADGEPLGFLSYL